MTYSSRDIDVIESLEAIRQRPAMYIGPVDAEHSMCSRLLESTIGNVAMDTPSPTAVRVTLWLGGVFTVAFDGEPLPIGLHARPATEIPHPELYRLFMDLAAGPSHHALGPVIVNALSERLVVATMHDGSPYQCSFRRGGLVSLLQKTASPEEVFGTNWITFKPDETVVPGTCTIEEARRLLQQISSQAPGVELSAIDRTTEKPYWR